MNQLKANDPKLAERLIISEQTIQKWIDENQGWQNLREDLDTIPVVVHVLWKTDIQNISDEQILSQIAVLNEDFGRFNADTINTPEDFQDEAGSVPFRFCLAKRDPDGAPTSGIQRRETTVSSWNGDAIKSYASGGLDAWDPESYLNIWVGNLSSGLLGYAEFPTNQVSNTFGVVVLYSAFGREGYVVSPYHLGRSTTHEFGHCFNAFHIWGDDNGGCNGSDLVDDTPNQANYTFGCPNYPKTDNCNSTPDGIMFMNYMDYSDDDCMNMFTWGQAERMVSAINSFYPSLLNSDGCMEVVLQQVDAGSSEIIEPAGLYCSPTLSPIINIKNWGTETLTSVTINYQIDGGTLSTYSWTGSLASLDTQSIFLPVITASEGIHTFTIFTSDPNATTDQNILNDTLTSEFSIVTTGVAAPLVEGFESSVFPPEGWKVINADGGITFERTTQYQKTGVASAWVDHYNYTNEGSIDDLISLQIDLSTLSNPALSYYYAYTYYNGSDGPFYDSLRIYISPDCGNTLNTIYYDGGNSMKTADPEATAYNPASSDWVQKIIDLSPYESYGIATLIFRSINGYGNNFYIDDININTSFGTGVENDFTSNNVAITPNPGNGFFNIQLPITNSEKRIVVINALGQIVYDKLIQDNSFVVDLSTMPSGMYFLRIDGEGISASEKIVLDR
jgi:hypothetical protein